MELLRRILWREPAIVVAVNVLPAWLEGWAVHNKTAIQLYKLDEAESSMEQEHRLR
jgi:hypothetical protein